MQAIAGFFRFWYDFIIGDDWLIAALIALCLVGLVLAGSSGLWWVLPVVVVVALALSLWRATSSAH
jgi:hypothetical protein